MNGNNKPLNVFDILSYWLALIAVVILLSVSQCIKSEENSSRNLVTAEWLEKNLKIENTLLLDASPNKIYAENHIAGAISINIYAFGVKDTPVDVMEKLFQSIGVSTDKKIVIYDQGGSILATRMFFSLYYHGFPEDNLFILDGGLSKWLANGFPVTSEVPLSIPPGTFKIKERKEDSRVMLDEFLSASGDLNKNVLLEALGAEMHFGKTRFFDKPGHIPGAVLLPGDDFFNEDKTFKSPEEIGKMLSYLGINKGQKILTHCGGGVAASVPFFVLKFILNYPEVKLFMESQMGWLSDERGLPFWTYDSPHMLRETNWIQSWGGKMLRVYGAVQVSIIDIRPAVEFNEGHLPLSVNIPVEIFKESITNPDKLVKILGSSGIDINQEAVIVSGEGLTRESALAFVMLEELGQKNVSVYMDSFDKFSLAGNKLVTDTSLFQPVNYTPISRNDIIISNKDAGKGLYPSIFIVSGINNPSTLSKGKVINIPYSDFLKPDGTPKEAKDILDIITNAGINRYAEIICVSDDPAEAAINYFIFKLMGYPDVKVLFE